MTETTYLVSGGSKGLGLEFTLDKLQCGHDVVLPMRPESASAWEQEYGADFPRAHVIECDFEDPQFGESLVRFLTAAGLSPSRVLHAAGGGLGHRNPLLDVQQFRELVEANLLGPVSINRVVIPLMNEVGFGRIVHVGSTAATHAVGSVGYNASKAALGAYVRTLGKEFVKNNVSISGINPGAFEAKNNSMARLKARNPEVHESFVENRLPLGKMMQAGDLFPLLDLLHSASGLVFSGSMVAIDAGESLAYDS